MKKINTLLLTAFTTLSLHAQSNVNAPNNSINVKSQSAIEELSTTHTDAFLKAMKNNIELYKTLKTPDEILKITNTMERIGSVEKNEWLPWYYCALNTITSAFTNSDPKLIDALVDKAEEYIAKAEAIAPSNSEIKTLKAMCMGARIMVDPMSRAQKFSAAASQELLEAKKLDPTNPRPYLYEAQSKFYTPEAFGGGKKVAKPIFEKALELFKNFKPKNEIDPNWGVEQVTALLEQCK